MSVFSNTQMAIKYGWRKIFSEWWKFFSSGCALLKAAELFSVRLPDNMKDHNALIFLLAASLVIAILLRFPKTIKGVWRSPNFIVEIRQGDICKQTGHILFGTNDVFDTDLGAIVSPQSVQGQILTNKFNSSISDFDKDIVDAIERQELGPGLRDANKTLGKNFRYPIGTTLVINLKHQKLFMVVCSTMTQKGQNCQAESNTSMVLDSISKAWDVVRESGNGREISTALLGTQFARSGIDRSSMIKMLVSSFIHASKKGLVSPKLIVVVRPQDLVHINWYDIEEFIKHSRD